MRTGQGLKKAAFGPPSRARLADVLPERSLCLLGDLAERGGIANREVGEGLTVECDPGLREAVDQAAIGQAMQPGGGVDAHDPQAPEVALLVAAVIRRVAERVHDGLMREPIVRAALTSMPLGEVED